MTAGSWTASPRTSSPSKAIRTWNIFPGNYREYEDDKKRRMGAEGAQPKRLRFKALK